MSYALGIDIGGTFTDVILLDDATGKVTAFKWLTTSDDPSRSVLEHVDRVLARTGLQPEEIARVVHATTLPTNALIERRGPRTALVTTRGFRDILEMGTETRYDMYDLDLDLPPPLIPRDLRWEVSERVNAQGKIVKDVDLNEVEELLDEAEDVVSVAIGFLHSYANEHHEQAVGQRIRQRLPDAYLSLSSIVAPEIGEFERLSTTVANAYLQPIVTGYLHRLEAGLRQKRILAPLYVMLSSGGIGSVSAAQEFPVRIIGSGPAAGVAAGIFVSRRVREASLITFDMGGTTAKVSFLDEGRASVVSEFEVARLERFKRGSGLPIKSRSVELIEIGAGGGSVARLDERRLLRVGPASAGSDPGPACYCRGGTEPTVTDADLVLGYLPSILQEGELSLDVEMARMALKPIADRIGFSVTDVAWGIHDIVNENMARAARVHLAERGRDPSAFGFVAFGGAGPVHATGVAGKLGAHGVIVPPVAGVISALGLLVAPPRVDLVRTYLTPLESIDWVRVRGLFQDMINEGRQLLAGVATGPVNMVRLADMRYVGQGAEVTVGLPEGELDAAKMDQVRERFSRVYASLYGRHVVNVPIEVVSWRAQLEGSTAAETSNIVIPVSVELEAIEPSGAILERRAAFFPDGSGFREVPVYDHRALRPGDLLKGPALIEASESTTVIGPHQSAAMDSDANLIVNLSDKTFVS